MYVHTRRKLLYSIYTGIDILYDIFLGNARIIRNPRVYILYDLNSYDATRILRIRVLVL